MAVDELRACIHKTKGRCIEGPQKRKRRMIGLRNHEFGSSWRISAIQKFARFWKQS